MNRKWIVVAALLAATAQAQAQERQQRPGARGRTVSIAALSDGGLAVVDPASGRLLRRVEGLTEATFGVVVNPANPAQAWAVGEKTGQLFELDLRRWEVTGQPVALSGTAGTAVASHQPVMTRDGRLVLVTTPGDNSLTIVDTQTRAVSKVPLNNDPHIVDIDPATGHVFVSRRGNASGPSRGATFLDLERLRAAVDLSKGVRVTPDQVNQLTQQGAYVEVPINGTPRVISALGNGRFAVAMYGKRGPLVYQVRDGKATLLDDLDNMTSRGGGPKANMEYLEMAVASADGRTLVGTDQGVPASLRVWDMDPTTGRGVRERRAIQLPAEPYWVNLSPDGRTAYVSVPKHKDAQGVEVTGSVLTVDVTSGRIVNEVAIGDDGKVHSPKRMITLELPADIVAAAERRPGMTDALQGVGQQR